MSAFDIQIEEFEGGSWIADLKSQQSFAGGFSLPDGSQWVGATVSERQDFEIYHTRVIGGQNKLGAKVLDKFYAGSVSLQIAVADVCSEAGESVGTVTPGLMLSNFQRVKGTAAAALDALADSFDLMWWIDRTGLVNMQTARPLGPDATGSRISSDVDASIILAEPTGLVVGVPYNLADPLASMPLIRHVRWHLSPERFTAQLYPVPFVFRAPMQTAYDRTYDALVDRDNGDGTIDVIVDGRYGESKVRLLSGIPGAKLTMHGGDEVTVGYLAGDPQQPYAVAMGQLASATKQIARNTDAVKITLSAPNIASLAGLITAPPGGGPCIPTPPGTATIDFNGTIQAGSSRVSLGD